MFPGSTPLRSLSGRGDHTITVSVIPGTLAILMHGLFFTIQMSQAHCESFSDIVHLQNPLLLPLLRIVDATHRCKSMRSPGCRVMAAQARRWAGLGNIDSFITVPILSWNSTGNSSQHRQLFWAGTQNTWISAFSPPIETPLARIVGAMAPGTWNFVLL